LPAGEVMKAIVQNAYGSPDLLECKQVEKPVPGDHEVLVRVCAAGLNAGDYFAMRGRPWLIRVTLATPWKRSARP